MCLTPLNRGYEVSTTHSHNFSLLFLGKKKKWFLQVHETRLKKIKNKKEIELINDHVSNPFEQSSPICGDEVSTTHSHNFSLYLEKNCLHACSGPLNIKAYLQAFKTVQQSIPPASVVVRFGSSKRFLESNLNKQ